MKIQLQIYLPDQNQGTVWGYGTITLDRLLTFQIRILTCEKGAGIKEAFVSFPRRKQGERWEDLVIVEDSLRNQITEAVREVIQMEITKDLYLPPIKVVHLQIFPKGKKKFLVGEATIRVLGVTVKGILLKQGKYGVFCQMPQYYSEKKGYQNAIYILPNGYGMRFFRLYWKLIRNDKRSRYGERTRKTGSIDGTARSRQTGDYDGSGI